MNKRAQNYTYQKTELSKQNKSTGAIKVDSMLKSNAVNKYRVFYHFYIVSAALRLTFLRISTD